MRELLEERIEAIEANEGRQVKGREKRELREALVLEMLPRAFVRSRLQYAWIDPRGQLLFEGFGRQLERTGEAVEGEISEPHGEGLSEKRR